MLFVVSAGNQIDDLLVDTPAGTLLGMTLAQRSALATRAICRDDMHRRVLAPAESVNALTVGASHSDASTVVPAGGRFQLFADGGLAPYSSIGPGFRRAVKPDILLPGGRVLYREATISPAGRTKLQPIESVQPPGQLVAAHPTPQGTTVYTRGTSNACALGTRWAARAHSVLEVLRAGTPRSKHSTTRCLSRLYWRMERGWAVCRPRSLMRGLTLLTGLPTPVGEPLRRTGGGRC